MNTGPCPNTDIIPDWSAYNPDRERFILIVDTPHKVGSTWVHRMLGEIGNLTTPAIPEPYNDNGTLQLENPSVVNYFRSLKGHFIFKSHSLPLEYELPSDLAEDIKFVTILRDPRDVLVSMAFYAGWYSGESKYTHLPDKEKVRHIIQDGSSWLLPELEAWFRSDAVKIYYRDVIKDPVYQMRNVVNRIGLAPLASESNIEGIREVVVAHSFQQQTGRKPGEENKTDFLRKGIPGDWRNYFDQELKDFFKSAADGRWNSLLVEMKYEPGPDW